MSKTKPSILLLYHFFHPDDVVSARHYTQFAQAFAGRGWDVTVLACNRRCRHGSGRIEPAEETWNGVRIIRVRRPGLNQANPILRLVNAVVTLTGWARRARQLPPQDAIVLGTDPQFAPLLIPALRRAHPAAVLAHWCFDLYPEAIMADRTGGVMSRLAGLTRPVLRRAYRKVDLMVDLGPCMRSRLAEYDHGAECATMPPWALAEPGEVTPPDPDTRRELFGDAELALLYSGNLGKAHDFDTFLRLARAVYPGNPRIVFCFACGGNRVDALRAAITDADRNVRIAGFCDEADLEKRLGAADMHLISLRPGWEGVVVPSKFFGSLAMGRPVLYTGPDTSDIATWIGQYDLGMTLEDGTMDEAVSRLLALAADRSQLATWQANARQASREHFSKRIVMDRWDSALRAAIESKAERVSAVSG